jgi:hypothetical protein
MAATLQMKLKDGAIATVSVSVELDTDAHGADQRRRDLENLLGGCLAGSADQVVCGRLVAVMPSNPTKEG